MQAKAPRDPIQCLTTHGNSIATGAAETKMGERYPRRKVSVETYILNSRLALPLRILTLSSSHSGTVSIHCTAGLLATNGQSTANRMRSMPISMTQHSSAGLEKLPLVVM